MSDQVQTPGNANAAPAPCKGDQGCACGPTCACGSECACNAGAPC